MSSHGGRPAQSEKGLQADICQHLSLLGYVCYEFARPGGRPKCPNCGAWVGRLSGGIPSGWPDIMVVKPNSDWPKVMFLEVKAATGRLEDAQRMRHLGLQRAGFPVRVVRSVEEAEQAVRYWL